MTRDELRRAAGQLLGVGFDGPGAPAELLGRIARSEVGSVMLFRPNIASAAQVAELVADLRGAAPKDLPIVVSTDQEGGAVQRLRAPLTVWPDMMTVGAADQPERTRALGAALGRELAALGIGWDLAPVLDVHTNPQNPVIGNRSFGTTPEAVERHGLAFWRGLREVGVAGCGKHFPGHGDTRTDSHATLPVIEHDEARLRAVELRPFAAAVRAGMEAIMTAHVMVTAWDRAEPATLSRRIATDLLRGELGFAGLLVSDDFGMKAVSERYPPGELAVRAVMAGVDHLLIRGPEDRQRAAFDALVRAAEDSSDARERIAEAAARVATFKATVAVPMPLPPERHAGLLGAPEHVALADELRAAGSHTVAAPGASPVSRI